MNCRRAGRREQPNFRYVPVLSEARPDDAWTGRTGFVHRAVMEDFPDLSGHQVYACGAPAMVDAARRDFTALCGLPGGPVLRRRLHVAGRPGTGLKRAGRDTDRLALRIASARPHPWSASVRNGSVAQRLQITCGYPLSDLAAEDESILASGAEVDAGVDPRVGTFPRGL